jgi:hypothetical protein
MWLDAIPHTPSLRLGDHAFQDAARVRMGVRTFSSFCNVWTCACGHTVKDDDVAHARCCNRLSELLLSLDVDIREALREFVSRLDFSSSCEGRYSGLALRTPNHSQAHWDLLQPAS